MDWGQLLFGFSGRINRAKLWLWVLLYFIIWIVAGGVVGIVAAFANDASGVVLVMFILFGVLGIASLISYLAVLIKRLHDRDKSGWWLLIFLLLPGVLVGMSMSTLLIDIINSGGNITAIPEMSPIGMILYLIGLAIGLWFFVELFCLRGSTGPNKYGPDPLEGHT